MPDISKTDLQEIADTCNINIDIDRVDYIKTNRKTYTVVESCKSVFTNDINIYDLKVFNKG